MCQDLVRIWILLYVSLICYSNCRGSQFRTAYASLGELRSIIASDVNIMALILFAAFWTSLELAVECVILQVVDACKYLQHLQTFVDNWLSVV